VGNLREWWGESIFEPDGRVNRRAIAARVFGNSIERQRLESLLHPFVNRRRVEIMEAAEKTETVAFVWDSPLLLETGLRGQCDVLVYVEAPRELRESRVLGSRGWEPAELVRRENLQWPLDKKRKLSDNVVDNTADAEFARGQVKDVLFRIKGKI
jgi:dephospho-CoA kinase